MEQRFASTEERQASSWGLRGTGFQAVIEQLARYEHHLGRSIRIDFTDRNRFEESLVEAEQITGWSFEVPPESDAPQDPLKGPLPDAPKLAPSDPVLRRFRPAAAQVRSLRHGLQPQALTS